MSANESKKQPFPGKSRYLFRVELTDKKGTPYRIDKPAQFLSQKSIERRKRQSLPIDSTDLPVSPRYIDAIRQAADVEIVGTSKWNNTVLVGSSHDETAQKLQTLPCVKKIVKVMTAPDSLLLSTRQTLSDKISHTDTLSKSAYGAGLWQIEMLNGVKLHEAGFRGKGMTIAVIDGGFMNADSISYFKNIDILGKKDFAYPASPNVCQEQNHGTMVLSTMGTNVPGTFIGTAPEASYWLLRSESGYFEQMCEEDFWAFAAEFADSVGVDLINSSLGYNEYDNGVGTYSYRELDGRHALISRTASMLAAKGIVHVNSAGNSGNNIWKKIGVPADATAILAVGALQMDRRNTIFSSLGPSADGRVKPDVMAPGLNTTVINGAGVISHASGTSFASPITCGMVACLWQALPHKSAFEIIELVKQAADRRNYPDNVFGFGIPDYWEAYQRGLD